MLDWIPVYALRNDPSVLRLDELEAELRRLEQLWTDFVEVHRIASTVGDYQLSVNASDYVKYLNQLEGLQNSLSVARALTNRAWTKYEGGAADLVLSRISHAALLYNLSQAYALVNAVGHSFVALRRELDERKALTETDEFARRLRLAVSADYEKGKLW